MAFVDAAGRDLAKRLLGRGDGDEVLLVQVAAQEEVDVLGQEIPGVAGIGEVGKGVMDQREAEAGEGVALRVRREARDLVLGEQELAAVVVAAAEPRGVEAEDVDVEGQVEAQQLGPVAEQAVRRALGEAIDDAEVLQPLAIGRAAREQGVAVPGLDAGRRRAAREPARPIDRIGPEQRRAEALPDALVDWALDVVVAGHDEDAVPGHREPRDQGLDEIGGGLVLVGAAPVGNVPGEGDDVDAGAVAEQLAEVPLPGVPEHAPPPPGLPLPRPALVEVRQVQDAQPVLRHILPMPDSQPRCPLSSAPRPALPHPPRPDRPRGLADPRSPAMVNPGG